MLVVCDAFHYQLHQSDSLEFIILEGKAWKKLISKAFLKAILECEKSFSYVGLFI